MAMGGDTNPPPRTPEGRWPTAAWWLVTALVAVTSTACSPPLPREYATPQAPPTAGEPNRPLSARALGELLPDWGRTVDDDVLVDYAGLKAAAITLARMPAAARHATIDMYSRTYCDLPWIAAHCDNSGSDREGRAHAWAEADFRRASGMYLLLRILFVLPTRYPASERERFTGWIRMPSRQGDEDDLLWPVHEDPGGRVLMVERCEGFKGRLEASVYRAMDEYDYFLSRYPMRTPAMLEALDIRPRHPASRRGPTIPHGTAVIAARVPGPSGVPTCTGSDQSTPS